MGLNELMNMIYNFLTLGNILALIFVFQKNLFSYAMGYNKLIKYTLVNNDKTFIFFSLPGPARIWLSPAGSLVDLMAYCNWITNSYTKHCFVLFCFVFLNFGFIYLFIFMAVLGLRFCVRAFSSCGKWGPFFIAVRGALIIAASLVAEHRLQTRRLSNCGSRTQLLRGMWDLPRPGLEPVSSALAGRFSTTAPPGKP